MKRIKSIFLLTILSLSLVFTTSPTDNIDTYHVDSSIDILEEFTGHSL